MVKKTQASLCGPSFAHANQLLSCKFEDKKKGAGERKFARCQAQMSRHSMSLVFFLIALLFRYIFIIKICGIKLREETEADEKYLCICNKNVMESLQMQHY